MAVDSAAIIYGVWLPKPATMQKVIDSICRSLFFLGGGGQKKTTLLPLHLSLQVLFELHGAISPIMKLLKNSENMYKDYTV